MMMLTPSISARVTPFSPAQPRFQGKKTQECKAQESKPDAQQQKTAYQSPRPNPLVMVLMTMLNRYWLFGGVPVLRSIPGVNHLPMVKGFKLKQVEIPAEDLQLLQEATDPQKNIFILTPNHPEFFTDMLTDKKVSELAAPSMAWMAAAKIVNGPQKRFMLANNIIANNGKEKSKEDSVSAALKGQGMLLHPEGHTMWHGDKVHPLMPGAVQMAIMAAENPESKDKPVKLLPIAWKYGFDTNVSQGLHKDMAYLEKRLNLPQNPKMSVADRFFALQRNMLSHQEEKFGFTSHLKDQRKVEEYQALHYFQQQQEFQAFLIRKLEEKYGDQAGQTTEQTMRGLDRVMTRANREKTIQVTREDRAMWREISRLEGFSPELYNRPHLTQDHLHETLKRSIQSFFEGQPKALFPKPAGKRTVHIRVAEPIAVREHLHPDMSDEEHQQVVDRLLPQVHQALQGKLDAINTEIAPSAKRFEVKNAFYTPVETL